MANIQQLLEAKNIAEDLDEEQLIKIGADVVDGYNNDLASRKKWVDNVEHYLRQALQVKEQKTYPWANAANVKYPIISTAAMQFAARAYPSLVPATGDIVKCRVIGSDPTGEKANRAKRISTHMSYQIMDQMEEWEDDMDKLLVIIAIAGQAYKKTFYCPDKGRNKSILIHPFDLVVNYWTDTLEDSERITEVIYKSKRQVKEKQRSKFYLEDIELNEPGAVPTDHKHDTHDQLTIPSEDETTPYRILEQHCYLDLDEDELPEPYVVTVEEDSRKVLRIAPRFVPEGIKTNEDGEVISIEPLHYYTKFGCIPNPDGSFYDLGFGHLLSGINDSVDTLINQLIDSGSLNNLQAGFIGKGLRIRKEDSKFTPGEWKQVNSTVDDLKKGIFPLPTKEPSAVLFQLLGMLVQSAKELASVAEIFVGKMPGQNTPAYTTKETVEQGMKLFTAIYKRVYRSLTKEFRKLYKLNRVYLDPQESVSVLDTPVEQNDYEGPEDDVVPAADPMASSRTEKEAKAMQLMQVLQLGTIDPNEVTMRVLDAMEQPNIEKLIRQGPPPPSPEQQKMEAEMQMKQQEGMQKQQESQQKMQLEAFKAQMKAQMEQMSMAMEKQRFEMEMYFKQLESVIDIKGKQAEQMMSLKQQQENHQMGLVQGQQKHQAALQQQKETQAAKPKEPKKPTK